MRTLYIGDKMQQDGPNEFHQRFHDYVKDKRLIAEAIEEEKRKQKALKKLDDDADDTDQDED